MILGLERGHVPSSYHCHYLALQIGIVGNGHGFLVTELVRPRFIALGKMVPRWPPKASNWSGTKMPEIFIVDI